MNGVHIWGPKTGATFFYSMSQPSTIQVLHIRKFCEKQPPFAKFTSRGPGFLKFTYKSKEPSDDFFTTFGYSPLCQSSSSVVDYVLIQLREVKKYKVTCELITHSIVCHSTTTVRCLRRSVAFKCSVLMDSVAILLNETHLEDSEPLFSPPTEKLTFKVQRYYVVPTTFGCVLVPESGTVMDLISIAQYTEFTLSGGEVVHEMQLMIDRSPLHPSDVVLNVRRPGVVIECVPGPPMKGQAIDHWFKFRFESGPTRTFMICSGCSLSFAHYQISKEALVQFERVELFWSSAFTTQADLRMSVGQFFATGQETLYVWVPSIVLRFDIPKGTNLAIPLSDRVFDVKQKIAKLEGTNSQDSVVCRSAFCQ
jgi:hypothetical protein